MASGRLLCMGPGKRPGPTNVSFQPLLSNSDWFCVQFVKYARTSCPRHVANCVHMWWWLLGLVCLANNADKLDMEEVDLAFKRLCERKSFVECGRDSKGRLKTSHGTYGKILIVSFKSRRPVSFYRSCSFKEGDQSFEPELVCPSSMLVPQTEKEIQAVVKLPFKRAMHLDTAPLNTDNSWLLEKRNLRKMGQMGFSPKVIDVMRYRQGQLRQHEWIPKGALVMEYVDGIPLANLYFSMIDELAGNLSLAEAWVRLRAATRAILLYIDFVGRLWHSSNRIRHCDVHWGNILIRRSPAFDAVDEMEMTHEGSFISLDDRKYMKADTSSGSGFVLDPSMVVGLDVSFSLRLHQAPPLLTDPTKQGHFCFALRNRREDIFEVDRSIRDMAVTRAKDVLRRVAGQSEPYLRKWVNSLEDLLKKPSVDHCYSAVSKIRENYRKASPNAKAQSKLDWVASLSKRNPEAVCSINDEETARDELEAGLTEIFVWLDGSMPSEAQRAGFKRSEFFLSDEPSKSFRVVSSHKTYGT